MDRFPPELDELLNARGRRLLAGARQVICYQAGDYSGPHNDHHPEDEGTCNGFVDLHIMFSNDAVAHQLLVYEERRYLSGAHAVSGAPSMAIYRLPFWHYTTPLI